MYVYHGHPMVSVVSAVVSVISWLSGQSIYSMVLSVMGWDEMGATLSPRVIDCNGTDY